ncbi:MAG: endonuclease/exonuclease/phosphatase (EEP) superfamily protein YafD [Cellvibrionaceae bacterium]|jgi:endonuclease/exonuclease/phosphatase (EEP) superfamily protein YafD
MIAVILAFIFNRSAGSTGLYTALIACVINGVIVIPYMVPRLNLGQVSEEALTLMSANVLYDNRTPEQLLAVIDEVNPDILILQEMSAHNQRRAAALWKKFPFASDSYNGGLREILVFSQRPFDSIDYIVGDKPWRPEAQIKLTFNGTQITILGIHPKAPMSASRFARRNAELDQIAEKIATLESPIIVAGDMNISPWTPIFRSFLRRAGLFDGRRRHGLNFSWSLNGNFPVIPIDHILYRGVNVHSFTSGPDTGSDHRPVIIEFSVPSAENQT